VSINRGYIQAKGKTFFAHNLPFENPAATDGFINNTLEHLRQSVQIGSSRRDEQQIELTLGAMAALVQLYAQIDYSRADASKTHAALASRYLSEAVKTIAQHNMADVMMEGVQLMGQSAHSILASGDPIDITSIINDIGVIAALGAVNEKYRPVTLTAIGQFSEIAVSLLRSGPHDVYAIRYVVDNLGASLTKVGKLFLNLPDTPFSNIARTYLAPYYSITADRSFLSRLTDLVDALIKAAADDKAAPKIIRKIEEWADGLHQPQKELLLLAIEKRSSFISDIINWITHLTKLLLALSNSSICDDNIRNKLRDHGLSLFCALSWIPDEIENISFVENYGMTEKLFEAAIDASGRECHECAKEMQEILLNWAFKAGKYQTGWGILERSLYSLATLALRWNLPTVSDLKRQIIEHLSSRDAPNSEIRDRTAREIRERAASLFRQGHRASRIESEMRRADQAAMKLLLEELANLLSPNTRDEIVSVYP
jgi:hypothetical protein